MFNMFGMLAPYCLVIVLTFVLYGRSAIQRPALTD